MGGALTWIVALVSVPMSLVAVFWDCGQTDELDASSEPKTRSFRFKVPKLAKDRSVVLIVMVVVVVIWLLLLLAYFGKNFRERSRRSQSRIFDIEAQYPDAVRFNLPNRLHNHPLARHQRMLSGGGRVF